MKHETQPDDLPARTASTMSDAIALSSPSGRMSKRARKEAKQRLRLELFGPGPFRRAFPKAPSGPASLRRHAAELRALAVRGMHPRKYPKEADKLEKEADRIEEEARITDKSQGCDSPGRDSGGPNAIDTRSQS